MGIHLYVVESMIQQPSFQLTLVLVKSFQVRISDGSRIQSDLFSPLHVEEGCWVLEIELQLLSIKNLYAYEVMSLAVEFRKG